MNYKILSQAKSLYSRMVCAMNSDNAYLDGTYEKAKKSYFEFCKVNNLSQDDVELFHQVGFYYQHELPAALEKAEIDVYRNYTNALARYYDNNGESKMATRLFEIAAGL
jgi:hypothetical protein